MFNVSCFVVLTMNFENRFARLGNIFGDIRVELREESVYIIESRLFKSFKKVTVPKIGFINVTVQHC